MNTLLVHSGGWKASQTELLTVPVPEETESYFPVPYGRFVEEVKLHLPRFGLRIKDESYALAREGRQMFGVLTCANGRAEKSHALAVGLRNSYDRSLAVVWWPGPGSFVVTTWPLPVKCPWLGNIR